jgi:hypothetical protein
MRPNLMSPRRATPSGEDSILALLEREPARKRGSKAAGLRLAWYGAGASLAVALTGALVWLAANNDGPRLEAQDMVLAEARQATQQPAAGALLRQVAMAPAAEAAVIVDQVDQPSPADAVPPLRLLRPAPEKTAAPAPAPAAAAPAPRVARAAAPPRPALLTPGEAKPLVRPATTPARPKPVMAAKGAVRPVPPKAQRGANPGKATEGPVDADVALISAVIVHANGHAPEGSQMTELLCPNDACQARPPRK